VSIPQVVVVGAASRDLAEDDPRGWRLGGGVCYSALSIARLGLRTAAIVGVDALAAGSSELVFLRDAGVELHLVPLEHGPVFANVERPEGRRQVCHAASDPIDPGLVPPGGTAAPGWILAPVAAELPEAWAAVPREDATVAVGWQGLLRDLQPGREVRNVPPAPSPIVRRADLVGLSRDDVSETLEVDDLYGMLRPGATLAITRGDRGGLIVHGARDDGSLHLRHYPAVRSPRVVDPTGAGDVFLAALAAARIEPRLVGGRIGQGFDLLLAAAAASLVTEGPGLNGVPSRDAVRARMAEARAAWRPSGSSSTSEPTRRSTPRPAGGGSGDTR
jgi:sugar/nucleoside kinase (ribokinase family)